MAPPVISIADDVGAAAREAATLFVAAARAAVAVRARFTVALAGGSTPRRLYEVLATAPDPRRLGEPWSWSQVEIFWGDERCVPPDHQDSNYRMAREALLDRVPVPSDHIWRMEGECEPHEAARRYERTLVQTLGDGSAPPQFDLVLLGMGADGHTASLFPGSPLLEERVHRVGATPPPAEGVWRVTLTAPVLAAARKVVFLVCGADKADVLRLALTNAATPDLPAGLISSRAADVHWVLDRAAAANLSM